MVNGQWPFHVFELSQLSDFKPFSHNAGGWSMTQKFPANKDASDVTVVRFRDAGIIYLQHEWFNCCARCSPALFLRLDHFRPLYVWFSMSILWTFKDFRCPPGSLSTQLNSIPSEWVKPVNQWRIGPGSLLKAQAFVQSETSKGRLNSRIWTSKSLQYIRANVVYS